MHEITTEGKVENFVRLIKKNSLIYTIYTKTLFYIFYKYYFVYF